MNMNMQSGEKVEYYDPNKPKAIYAKGLYFNKLKPETPDSVKKWKKGGVSIHIENFTAQLAELKEYANDKGYINFDLTENEKDGEKFLSFKLNTWKPEPKDADKTYDSLDTAKEIEEELKYPEEDINPEDIPF